MANYYNEFDPKAAAWLKQLIVDGLIPKGEVDERSIAEVRPADLVGFRQCHFFAGIRPLAAPEKRKAVLNAARAAYFRILSAPEYLPAVSAATNGPLTIDTFGRNFIGSSASANLQSFLENRLRVRMGKYGSLEYELVWKSKDMALGPAICARRASQRRTSDNDCTGWPSPVASKTTPQQRSDFTPTLAAVAEKAILSGYPTPRAEDVESAGMRHSRGVADTLTAVARQTPLESSALSGWPTPKTPTGGANSKRDDRGAGGPDLQEVAKQTCGWARPSARDWKDTSGMATTGTNPDGTVRNRNDQLPRQAAQAISGWASPTMTDAERGVNPPRPTDTGIPLSQQAGMVSGTTGESSTLPTEKRGALNPELSRWLQGFPETWTCSGRMAMPSTRTSPRNSSRRSSTSKKNLPPDYETKP